MRLWSIHPKYLDARGLVALWREGLLARRVLEGSTRGYRNHPQLMRFRAQKNPLEVIEAYLWVVWQEAKARGYRFDRQKVRETVLTQVLPVTLGQLEYEWTHLLKKLSVRAPRRFAILNCIIAPQPHPVMTVIPGPVESWEAVR